MTIWGIENEIFNLQAIIYGNNTIFIVVSLLLSIQYSYSKCHVMAVNESDGCSTITL